MRESKIPQTDIWKGINRRCVLNILFYSSVIITYAPSRVNLPCVIWTCVRSAQLLRWLCLHEHSRSLPEGGKQQIEGRLETPDCGYFLLSSSWNCYSADQADSCLCKTYFMEIGVIVYLDEALWCKLRTTPFRLSHFPNAADLLSCNRWAFHSMPPLLWFFQFSPCSL